MRRLAILLWLAACAHTPAPPRLADAPAPGASAADVESTTVEKLQRRECVGQKGAANVIAAKDGQCLCYDPPWEGGVRPPDERERERRQDFDGVFLCRPSPGTPPSSASDGRYCPVAQPVAGAACSARDAMLRNADCLYVATDMQTPVHLRCEAERWREVPEAEVQRERMTRP